MVIGNGLIASQFKEYKNNNATLIFASGVSNSKECSKEEYEREFGLLRKYIEICSEMKFVYFSTISIFDNSLSNTPYIKHKIQIEEFIKQNVSNYIIFRLPIIISKSKNPNTLINYFINSIINNKIITAHSGACRYLINISDCYKICDYYLQGQTNNVILNINFPFNYKINEILNAIEIVFKKEGIIIYENKGDCYKVESDIPFSLLENLKINKYSYLEKSLRSLLEQ